MLKLLALLIPIVERLLAYFTERQKTETERQAARTEQKEAVQANVAKADAAVSTVDDVRTERLRSRFDRSYGNE